MILDHSVYPDISPPPDDLPTPEDKADYIHRICSAFDFGIYPGRSDWELFAGWKDVFDRFPLPYSPAWHTFRSKYRWEDGPREYDFGVHAPWKDQDLVEGRTDPCEEMV